MITDGNVSISGKYLLAIDCVDISIIGEYQVWYKNINLNYSKNWVKYLYNNNLKDYQRAFENRIIKLRKQKINEILK